jgi:hypothetical protein
MTRKHIVFIAIVEVPVTDDADPFPFDVDAEGEEVSETRNLFDLVQCVGRESAEVRVA